MLLPPFFRCCRDSLCSNDLIIWALALMAFWWAMVVTTEADTISNNAFGAIAAMEDERPDTAVTEFTKMLCTGTPSFRFHVECSSTVTTGSGKNRSTKKVVTHAANSAWPSRGEVKATEISGQALVPSRAGISGVTGLQIPWVDFDGGTHVTSSRSGTVEVRFPEVRISFASQATEDKFARDFAAFMVEGKNKSGVSQRYWIEVSLPGRPPSGLKVFQLRGTSIKFGGGYTSAILYVLGLGWIFQLW